MIVLIIGRDNAFDPIAIDLFALTYSLPCKEYVMQSLGVRQGVGILPLTYALILIA